MSRLAGPREPGAGGDVDLAAVARDAELLDRLAGRAGTPAGDRVAALLAALAADVDDGLDELLAAWADADGGTAPVVPLPLRRRHGRGLRATTVAVVIGATLSVSGVAAAVTGDPLAAYRGLVSAVTGGHHDLPDNAAQVARFQHLLTGTRARIAHGDLDGARADLAALRARLASSTLTAGQRRSLAARIAALEAAIERAASKPSPSAAPTGKNAAPHGNTVGNAGGSTRSGTGPSTAKTERPAHGHTKPGRPARGSGGSAAEQKTSDPTTSDATTSDPTTTSDPSATEPASQPTADSTAAPTADASAPSSGRGHGPSGGVSQGKAQGRASSG